MSEPASKALLRGLNELGVTPDELEGIVNTAALAGHLDIAQNTGTYLRVLHELAVGGHKKKKVVRKLNTFLRDDNNQLILPQYDMDALVDVEVTEETLPPSREALVYLLNQVLGAPPTRKRAPGEKIKEEQKNDPDAKPFRLVAINDNGAERQVTEIRIEEIDQDAIDADYSEEDEDVIDPLE